VTFTNFGSDCVTDKVKYHNSHFTHMPKEIINSFTEYKLDSYIKV